MAITPTYPMTIFDSFSRTGSVWGTSDSGHVWSGDTSGLWTTLGGVATINSLATSTAFYDIARIGSANLSSYESLIRLQFSSNAANPYTDCGPVVFASAENTAYMVRIRNNEDRIAIALLKDGEWSTITSITFPMQKTSVYWVRTSASSQGIKTKMWKYGTAEPSSWTLEAPLVVGGPTKGQMGFGVRRTASTYQANLTCFYGYYKPDVSPATMPVTDTFTREIPTGWGLNTSKQIWEGHVNYDPRLYDVEGFVTVSDGFARISHNGNTEIPRNAFIGPSISGNVEAVLKFQFVTNTNQQTTDLGICGDYQVVDGVLQWKGYMVRVQSNATNLAMYKRTAFSDVVYTALTPTTNTAFTAIAANVTYVVKFQKIGTTLQARVWQDGTAEPGTWQFITTDASLTSGRLWISADQLSASTTQRNNIFSEISLSQNTTGTPPTTVGALTVTSKTDTTIALRASFTNDSDADNTVNFYYRVQGTPYWFDDNDAPSTRVASPLSWTHTITELTPNTTYEIEARFQDADGVLGTNPATLTVTTNNEGLLPGVATVTATTTTSVDIQATYIDDTDADSAATVDYRVSSKINYAVLDSFDGLPETLLTDHTADVGGAWIKHASYGASQTGAMRINERRVYASDLLIGSGNNYDLLYYNNTPLEREQTVRAKFYNPAFDALGLSFDGGTTTETAKSHGSIGVAGRISTATNSMYRLYYATDWDSGFWILEEIVAGSSMNSSPPGTYFMGLEEDSVIEIELVIRDDTKIGYVNGIEVARLTTNNHAPTTSYAGVFLNADSIYEQSNDVDEQRVFTEFEATYRTTGTSWTSAGAMTADRPNKRFTKTIGSLTADTTYEFRVSYTDVDSIHVDPNRWIQDPTTFFDYPAYAKTSVVTTTMGSGARLNAMTAVIRATSIVVETTYLFDTNNNSVLTMQYRPIYDFLWTSIPASLITVNRGSKKFTGLVPSLRPNTTYEVQAIISDVNGVDGATTLTTTLTTKGPQDNTKKESKHYLWKIYDSESRYITTWHDAGEPNFAWHENGGVSDLTVTLPRSISSLNDSNSGVSHQNRVDVWAVDPSSNGFGPNMVNDSEFTLGSWVLGSNAVITLTGGPDDSGSLKITSAVTTQVVTRSEPIYLYRQPIDGGTSSYPIPLVAEAIAKAAGSKLTLFVESYDVNDIKLDTSNTVDTVGNEWQTIRVEYMPPPKTLYVRVCFRNDSKGTMYADKVSLKAKELLIYRGRIENYTPRLEQDGEDITVEILGLVSLLSDDYIEFLQFEDIQPLKDVEAGRVTHGAMDPAEMLRMIIDRARKQNPHFALYYTTESIRNTGQVAEYTFRDQQLRACLDRIRNLCPPGWHYYIEADGLVVLRGPEHAPTHNLRIGVEVMNFQVDRSIRNLKNYIEVKGRQDEDESEPDGHGSIKYIVFDQESINKYGKRMLFIRDSNITDPETAEIVGNGRLEEYNREEQRAQCYIPDEKSIFYVGGALKGDNIERFRPGDNVIILDPLTEARQTFWDQMIWDKDAWDANVTFKPLPESVPTKTVQYNGDSVSIELSERQPSGTSDFGRLYRLLQLKDAEQGD